MSSGNDFLISLLNDFLSDHPETEKYLPQITEKLIGDALDETELPADREYITRLIMSRYDLINKKEMTL